MTKDMAPDRAALKEQLDQALATADRLGLDIVAIHIDEAIAQLTQENAPADRATIPIA